MSWFALLIAGLVSVLLLVIAMGVASLYAVDPEGRGGTQIGVSVTVALCAAVAAVLTIVLAVAKALG